MRLPDWKERLRAELAAAAQEPFRYGAHDCFQLVARGVRAVTGVDHAARFAAYRSFTGANRILRRYGYEPGRLVSEVLGPPVTPHLVAAGDVVEAELEGGTTVGLCEGYTCAFAGGCGVVRRDRSVIRRGWKVS